MPSVLRPDNALVSVDGSGGLVRLAIVVVVCTGLAAVVNHWGRLGHGRDDVLAALRACLQLGVVGLLIAAVLESWWLTLVFIILMLSVASFTAGRRLTRQGAWWLASAPVAAGAIPVAAGLMLSGLIPYKPIAVVPIFGILIGGAMTATTLAGKRSLDALRTRRGEYEAGLSIGLLPRDAALLIARHDAALALVPGLDQTRTVGLVTLPGAFVGMLLGGASPLQAAAVQLVVLVALLLVQAIAVLVTVELVASGRFAVPAEAPLSA
jgi:putative ABC transport system permease protein